MSASLNGDVVVIGAGIAGQSAALRLAQAGRRVIVLTKTELSRSASYWAQGGVAAALHAADTAQLHAADTADAGAGLSKPETVAAVTEAAPDLIRWLDRLGVAFSRESDGDFHLGREGGHSERRIVHAHDATGKAIMTTLEQHVRRHPNIRMLEHHVVLDVLASRPVRGEAAQCRGLQILDPETSELISLTGPRVILASGGAAGIYNATTNPATSTGDGIAMAWRAGCRVANLEFVQFHPTALFDPAGAKPLLISEALRGEGARLLLPNGERFMHRYDKRAELAPRDIVARAIFEQMNNHGTSHVLLDISFKSGQFIDEHFPTIAAACLLRGIDIKREPIPVAPAAHYTCGGVVTNGYGATDVQGLYAIGECAFTGLHGANRLASNSLLEGLVFAQRCAEEILTHSTVHQTTLVAEPIKPAAEASADVVGQLRERVGQLMWDRVGIVRSNTGLVQAQAELVTINRRIAKLIEHHQPNPQLMALRNVGLVAALTTACALQRQESRGGHFNSDLPATLTVPTDSILTPQLAAITQAA